MTGTPAVTCAVCRAALERVMGDGVCLLAIGVLDRVALQLVWTCVRCGAEVPQS